MHAARQASCGEWGTECWAHKAITLNLDALPPWSCGTIYAGGSHPPPSSPALYVPPHSCRAVPTTLVLDILVPVPLVRLLISYHWVSPSKSIFMWASLAICFITPYLFISYIHRPMFFLLLPWLFYLLAHCSSNTKDHNFSSFQYQ
jgi:hypothetical protein